MKLPKRPKLGIALLAVGLILSYSVWNAILTGQGDDSRFVHVTYAGPHNRILFPTSFEMFEVPDYLLRYLVLGVFTTTVGITIVASPLLKRLAGIEDD